MKDIKTVILSLTLALLTSPASASIADLPIIKLDSLETVQLSEGRMFQRVQVGLEFETIEGQSRFRPAGRLASLVDLKLLEFVYRSQLATGITRQRRTTVKDYSIKSVIAKLQSTENFDSEPWSPEDVQKFREDLRSTDYENVRVFAYEIFSDQRGGSSRDYLAFIVDRERRIAWMLKRSILED